MQKEHFLDFISKQTSLLESADRNNRKNGLTNIYKEFLACSDSLPATTFQEAFFSLHTDLLLCLNDSVEKCRELAADILLYFIRGSTSVNETISSKIIGTLLLCLTSPDEREASEEVRLLEIDILQHLVDRAGENIIIHMHDIVTILENCIVDSSPDIKRKSCECAADVAFLFRSEFKIVSDSLIAPLLHTISHQHWKTRASCIMAIGSVVQYGNNANVMGVINHLAQRLFDHASPVRGVVVHVVGTWLVDLPDRYSFFAQLIPLLLSSLTDEVIEIRMQALEYWKNAGKLYLEENEKNYKDQIDFPKPKPEDYPGLQPTLGCRILVQQYYGSILRALLNDMNNWVAETRAKSSDLLYTLLLHCEEKATMKLQEFLQGILIAARDDEQKTVEIALKTAELLGYFTDVELWCKNHLPLILQKPTAFHLSVLAALLRGAKSKEFPNSYKTICDTLAEPYISRIQKPEEQAHLLLCVEALLLSVNKVESESSFLLFSTLMSIAGVTSSESITKKVEQLLQLLSSLQSMNSVELLFHQHSQEFLEEISANHELWTLINPEVFIFTHLVDKAYFVSGVISLAVPIIVVNLNTEKEPKVRSQMLSLVASVLKRRPEEIEGNLSPTTVFQLVHSGVFPNLVWSAGQVAAAIRTIAAASLLEVLKTDRIDFKMLSSVGAELLAILNSLADDNIPANRLLACKILEQALPKLSIDEHCIHNTIQEFLRCLDDERDDIRIAAIHTFEAYFKVFPKDYNWANYNPFLQHIFQNMLIHMDDPKENLRKEVFELLKEVAFASPDVLLKELDEVRHVMAATDLCEELTQRIKSLQIKSS